MDDKQTLALLDALYRIRTTAQYTGNLEDIVQVIFDRADKTIKDFQTESKQDRPF